MATSKNKVNLDLLKSETIIIRSGRPLRSPERYKQNEHKSKHFKRWV
jgi:hypothetical protein